MEEPVGNRPVFRGRISGTRIYENGVYHLMERWRLLNHNSPCDSFYNMAVDEALALSWTEGKSLPVLRIYQWQAPALTIGYGQRVYDEINIGYLRNEGIDLLRRVTGGRAVLHGNDLTYSVIAGIKGFFPDSITGSSKIIQAALLDALAATGIRAAMERSGTRVRRAACFSSASLNEITVNGKKISGSAQRRLKGAFLQHGSILLSAGTGRLVNCFNYPSPGKKEEYLELLNRWMTGVNDVLESPVNYNSLKNAVIRGAEERFNAEFFPSALTEHESGLVKVLEKKKREESAVLTRL